MWVLIVASLAGLGFVNIISQKIGLFFRILLAPALGLFIFTQIALIFSFIFGVNNISIALALLFSIILSVIMIFSLSLTGILKHIFQSFNLKQKIKSFNLPIIFTLTTLVVVGFLSYIWLTQALSITNEGFKTGGGGMYGDSALHAAYVSRLETGEFPSQNPLFAGNILVYPLANDLLSAILKINGLNFNLALALPQILFLIGFLVLFYLICRKFTSNKGFLIALALLFLGWGVGALFFFNEWIASGGSFWQSLTNDFTDNPSYNLYFRNILTGLILPERSFLPGLFLGLLMTFNFIEYFQDKKLRYLTINGLILGTLPFWHTHTFIFFLITTLVFSFWFIAKDNFKKTFIHFTIMFLITLLFAIPFLILFLINHTFGNFIHFSSGWQNGTENLLIFWFKNSFLVIPLAILGFIFIKKEQKILFVPPFIVFIAANIIIFQPWDWDNIKLLSWSFLFFVILAATFLVRYIRKSKIFAFLIFLVVFISCISGILSIAFQLKNKYVIYDKEDISLATWVKNNTNVDDIFAIEPTPNNPVPGLSGRLVFFGYPGHLWVHGINYSERENINSQILSGNFSLIKNHHLPISYVVAPVNSFSDKQNVKEVFRNQKYQVFKII